MRFRSRRGSVLVHVLITAVIVSFIAVGLAQMLLLRYTATARATAGTGGRKANEGALNRLLMQWNATNTYCSAPSGYVCTGTPGSSGPANCSCTCTPSPSCSCPAAPASDPTACPPTITASWNGASCSLTITTCN